MLSLTLYMFIGDTYMYMYNCMYHLLLPVVHVVPVIVFPLDLYIILCLSGWSTGTKQELVIFKV